MQTNILKIHEKVFNFLYQEHVKNRTFLFRVRRSDSKNRLTQGFWFRGNMDYLSFTFWSGNDAKEKVYPINFNIYSDKTCSVSLSAQDPEENAAYLEPLARILRCKKNGSKHVWEKKYAGTQYLEVLKNFIAGDKVVIDGYIRKWPNGHIHFLDLARFRQDVATIQARRTQLAEYGALNKISKICWNENGWQRPSGPFGKSQSKKHTYEARTGYGHEEWLFNRGRKIDGYHYSFLQPLSKGDHVGHRYRITLYSHNSHNNEKYFVAEIEDVECISAEDSSRAYERYQQQGWLDEMRKEILAVGGNCSGFESASKDNFFNMRFRFENVRKPDEPIAIDKNDINMTSLHYTLMNKRSDLTFQTIEAEERDSEDAEDGYEATGTGRKRNEKKRRRVYQVDAEYNAQHEKLQNALRDYFNHHKHEYGYDVVYVEAGHVDVKAKTVDGDWHYFEIKTDAPKLSIRRALGQILEYCYFSKQCRAKKLFIVTDQPADEKIAAYMLHLRATSAIPIFYLHFDLEKKVLSAPA